VARIEKEQRKKKTFSINKTNKWKENLNELFDIAHANSNDLITVEEDREFLRLQREGRKGKIMGVDKKYEKLRRKTTKSQEKMEKKRVRETSEFDDTAVLVSSSSSCSHSNSSTEDEVDLTQPSTSRPRGTPQRKKRKIMDENLLSLLDVAKVSDRAASLIMIPTIANVGKDPEEYNVSYSSIRRARQKSREKFSENLKKQFQTDKPLIIHWDGKLLEDITGNEV
jgi:hypothetical protein